MNAQGVKDEEHFERLMEDPNYFAQEKLDGMRALVHITKDGLRFFSRNAGVNDPTRPLEKTSALPHLAALKFPSLVGTVLDCEILLPGKDSATLAGTVHRKNSNGASKSVQMFVFDILSYPKGQDITNENLAYRISMLTIISSRIESEYIHILPYARDTEAKWTMYNEIKAKNGEGIMLKNLLANYLQGGRPSKNWYKMKKSATFDCICIGFTKGEGKYNNHIGAIRFGQYDASGKLIEIGTASGMSDAIRKEMSFYPERYIGKVITIKGMERMKSGHIRHPQFVTIRTDKKPKECVWYHGEQ